MVVAVWLGKNNFAVVPLPNYLVPLFIPSSNKNKDANSKESDFLMEQQCL